MPTRIAMAAGCSAPLRLRLRLPHDRTLDREPGRADALVDLGEIALHFVDQAVEVVEAHDADHGAVDALLDVGQAPERVGVPWQGAEAQLALGEGVADGARGGPIAEEEAHAPVAV